MRREFGLTLKTSHLFCHQATLGGCLQTSQVVCATVEDQEKEATEKLRAEVGIASLSLRRLRRCSHESQGSKSEFNKSKQQNETMFEATGGNSIRVGDPSAWCGSVADYNTWRVIDQSALSPLPDAIAGLGTKYAMVKSDSCRRFQS